MLSDGFRIGAVSTVGKATTFISSGILMPFPVLPGTHRKLAFRLKHGSEISRQQKGLSSK